jgi:hypothetical protein
MNKKSILIKFAVVFVVLLGLSVSIAAQRKRTPTRRTATKPPATTPVSATANTLEIKAGAEKVSTQIKNVTKYIYTLGGIARVIEDLDKEIKAGKASRAAGDLNAKNKQAVIRSINDLRTGLAALEVEFRTKPALRTYLVHIQGITDMSGTAEDLANDGRLTDAGRVLLQVVEKLSDTLAAMP